VEWKPAEEMTQGVGKYGGKDETGEWGQNWEKEGQRARTGRASILTVISFSPHKHFSYHLFAKFPIG